MAVSALTVSVLAVLVWAVFVFAVFVFAVFVFVALVVLAFAFVVLPVDLAVDLPVDFWVLVLPVFAVPLVWGVFAPVEGVELESAAGCLGMGEGRGNVP